jgi:hypothetical protein
MTATDGDPPLWTTRAQVVASWILIVLGLAHGLAAVVDAFAPTFLAPSDPALLAALRATPVTLGELLGGGRMTVWRGHVGWNISHGLGLTLVGVLPLRLRALGSAALRPVLAFAAAASLGWTVLAVTCWFWIPAVAIALATLGFMLAWRGLPERVTPRARGPRRLLALGILPMGVAGALHGVAVLPDLFGRGLFAPWDPAVRPMMEHSGLVLAAAFGSSTTFWRAYVGFNFSHALAVTAFAVLGWICARDPIAGRDRTVGILFALAACAWCATAAAFWFYAPIAVALIAATTSVVAAARRT